MEERKQSCSDSEQMWPHFVCSHCLETSEQQLTEQSEVECDALGSCGCEQSWLIVADLRSVKQST
jgi:hypothetical protein